jgi:hypothetical protein
VRLPFRHREQVDAPQPRRRRGRLDLTHPDGEQAPELAEIARLTVTDATRHPLFAEPVAVSPAACPSDRLVAFLGRHPAT